MTQPPPDDQAGSRRPRRAADASRAVAILLLVVGAIGGVVVGGGIPDPAAGWAIAVTGGFAAFAVWVASVLLGWAAALYDELRRE